MTHRHLSSVITAVIKQDTRENVTWGNPAVKYVMSKASKGKSAAMTAGVNKMFAQIIVIRLARSDIARPV